MPVPHLRRLAPAAGLVRLCRTAAAAATTAATAAALTLAPAPAGAQRTFTSVTFFGDSYVDTGNNFIASGGTNPGPPYATGRYSNGPVWADYLAAALGRPQDALAQVRPGGFGASGNYAFGGARTVDVPLGGGNVIPGTGSQIGLYLRPPGSPAARSADPTGLYALFIGGNDLAAALGVADPAARQAAVTAAGAAVVAQTQALVNAGARNVLVFTLGGLSRTPGVLVNPGAAPLADQLTGLFNGTVAAGLATLQPTLPGGTTVFNFRLDNLFSNIVLDAAQGGPRFGITNLTVPCLIPAPPAGVSCDNSLFVDAIHPTTRAHQLVANSVATYVTTGQNVAVIPEPATLALVGGGLALAGGAGAVRRRRAA